MAKVVKKNYQFRDLFVKILKSINIWIPVLNSKIYTRGDWGQNKDGTNIFKGDENTNSKKNDKNNSRF